MKRITFTADEQLIARARARAGTHQTTLSAEFRRWLEEYSRVPEDGGDWLGVVKRIRGHASSAGHRFTRDEMNER